MLGRKDYNPEEVDNAQRAVNEQLAAYKKLAKAVEESSDPQATSALEALEPLLFNQMALALDRYFVHRLRMTTGKDGNPVNELELVADSLMNNGGVLRGNNVIKFLPEKSVLKLNLGDDIELSARDFQRLSSAFFADLESKFVTERAAA
jgi:hypothetical protein